MAAPDKFPLDPEATLAGGVATRSPSGGVTATGAAFGPAGDLLAPGSVVGDRYEILAILGQGGMGAVYKAHDRVLDRVVAVKTIRPEMAANAETLARFKQEVLLASQITHPNVIRLYDLGEAGGLKFITMEFVEGEDLRSLLAKGKFTPADAAAVMRQICLALQAAHAKGVIHRDLKPQNVMRDKDQRIIVMDFGLARSVGFDGMTQTGALVGTMEYMSPEQAMAGKVDQRSDVFAVGLIFYELLTGKMPYKAESALASLLKRSQERAVPVSEVDDSVPRSLSSIVARCLEREPEKRFQNVTELLEALDRDVRVVAVRYQLRGWERSSRRVWLVVAGAVLAVGLAAGVLAFRGRFGSTAHHAVAMGPAVSMAILPLRNASGDPKMEWLGSSVADMLVTEVGSSAQLRMVSSDRMHHILSDLHIGPEANVDDSTRRRLAGFSNADVIVWGQYLLLGNRIRFDLTLQDLKNDRTVPIKAEAGGENDVSAAVDRVAQSIRDHLALSPEAIKQLQASAFKPSTNSIAALRAYNEGLDHLRHSRNLEAQKALEAATKSDPKFALAFSLLGQTYSNLGYGEQAEQASRRAVELSDALPDPEKYQITAEHARIVKNFPKAIEAYSRMAEVRPEDTDVQYALARLYEETRSLDKAHDHYDRLLARDPKNVDALLGMGRVDILRGDSQASLEYLNRAVGLSVQLNNEEQKAAALSFLGQAYSELNQPNDALRSLQESLEIRRAQGDKGGTGFTLNSMARVQAMIDRPADALKSWQDALRIRREIGDKHGTANTLLDMGNFHDMRGQYDQAIELTKQSLQLQRELGDSVNEGMCLNNIGWVYLEKADYENAMTYLQQALDVREKLKDPGSIAETLDNIANASSKMGQYDAALNYFLRSLELWRKTDDKRGLAVAAYDMGTVFEYQGRYGAALKSEADALDNFKQVKERGLLLAQALGGYGNALALVGRDADAEKNLKEALGMARELKNDSLTAHLLNFEGNRLFYRGDYNSARIVFSQALSAASRAKAKEDTLIAKLGLAKVAVKDGRARKSLKTLKPLVDEADRMGLKYFSAEAATYLAEGLIKSGDYRLAQDNLNHALTITEKLNLAGLQTRCHFLLATALHLSGADTDASHHYSEARRLFEQIRKEAGTDDVLKRSDLAGIASVSSNAP